MTTENKTWNFNYYNRCELHFEFTKSVDIRKAFAAIPAEKATWLEYLIETDTDTFTVNARIRTEGFLEEVPAFYKAVAETFSDVTFTGNAWFSDTSCYWEDSYEISYNDGLLCMTETFADDEYGYFCPECGYWVAPYNETFDDDEEIECDDCEALIKVSDLKYVPPLVEKHEIRIK